MILKNKRLDGYRIEDGKVCIDISLTNPDRLFDLRDPSPFLNRDLDDDLIDYVVSATQEFPLNYPIKLHIYFSERNLSRKKKQPITDDDICLAIRNYFTYMAKLTDKKLNKNIKNYQLFLGMGIILLISCLLGIEVLSTIKEDSFLRILKEGMSIVGWVSLWRPLESLLFDWWPTYEKRKTFEKIANIDISITDLQTDKTSINKILKEEKNGHSTDIQIETGNSTTS